MKLFKCSFIEKYSTLPRFLELFPEFRQPLTDPDCIPETRLNFKNPYLLIYTSKNYVLPIKLKLYMSTLNLESFINFGEGLLLQKFFETNLTSKNVF